MAQTYENDRLAGAMLRKMGRHRESGEFCDVTLIVGDVEIKAHKVVLSAFSQFFEGLLKPYMKEGHQDRIEIHDINAEAAQLLIDFAYSGKLGITPGNVQCVLEAADFLSLDAVCQACFKFMQENIEPDNCIGVLRCAMVYNAATLKDSAVAIALEHFPAVVKAEEIYLAPASILCEILASERLAIEGLSPGQQEKMILEVVMKFLEKNHLEASPEAVALFERVRLPLLEKHDVAALRESDAVSKNKPVRKLVESRSRVEAKRATDTRAESWMRPRIFHGLKVVESEEFGESYHFKHVTQFSDEEEGKDSYVAGMEVFVRSWDGRPSIGGLEVIYASGRRTTHGLKNDPPSPPEFRLRDNQRIARVTLRSGWLVDQIGFVSDTGRQIGPFGGTGGAERDPMPEEDGPTGAPRSLFLKYVSGEIGQDQGGSVLCGLQLHYGYYDYEQQ